MSAIDAEHSAHITELVREQYERFPYPDLDPGEMPKGWVTTSIMPLMCPLVWGGRRTADDAMHILDAGCGTGGPSAQLALMSPRSKVVGIDLSQASLARSRARKERLGLDNLEYHRLSLLDVGELGMTFDYIVTTGVLHHMPDPDEGLRALRSVLDPHGAIAIMLYGQYGRVGVYMLQRAMQLLANPDEDIDYHIDLARQAMLSAPPWFPAHIPSYGFEMQPGNKGGIVDLLLHAQDRAYTVDDIHAMLHACDMRFHRWMVPHLYDPKPHLGRDPELANSLHAMSNEHADQIGELVHGALHKHTFVAVRPEFEPPRIDIRDGRWKKLGIVKYFEYTWDPSEADPETGRLTGSPDTTEHRDRLTLSVHPWQAEFIKALSHVPTHTMDVLRSPSVRRAMPSMPGYQRDAMVEELIGALVQRGGAILVEEEHIRG
ncbi:MAG: methyltransferase domain-containing protein [Armatimonadia bacterium]|nr:methyltransferase domain-containing protein [Armatimonadia bacterium]